MQKDKLFSKIGQLTVEFATLEHRLQSLLKMLMREDCPLIGPFFIHELNLAVLLRKVKHIARYRLEADDPLLNDLESALKRIDGTRDVRNLLVHGNWVIDETNAAHPVRVRDFKMRYEDGRWQDLTETAFNEKRLTHLVRKLQGLSTEVEHLVHRLRQP